MESNKRTTIEEAALAMLKAKREHQAAELEEAERRRAKDHVLAQLHGTFVRARETLEQLLSDALDDKSDLLETLFDKATARKDDNRPPRKTPKP